VEALKGRDFLRVADWGREELLAVLDLADRLKDERKRYVDVPLLPGRSVGLILEKPSLRTRVSFELAVEQLGGHAVHLTGPEIGLGEREATRDVAYVLSRYLDAIMIRTFAQSLVEELAEHAYIPVVNGLTDETHPCQALADAMTIRERLGRLEGVRVAWLGDGNNVCASLMVICAKLGLELVAAIPPKYEPSPEALEAARAAGGHPVIVEDPREAAAGADVLYTDTWTSMGQEHEREARRRAFARHRVDSDLLVQVSV
jgi:ornithine carbamoyltransferase